MKKDDLNIEKACERIVNYHENSFAQMLHYLDLIEKDESLNLESFKKELEVFEEDYFNFFALPVYYEIRVKLAIREKHFQDGEFYLRSFCKTLDNLEKFGDKIPKSLKLIYLELKEEFTGEISKLGVYKNEGEIHRLAELVCNLDHKKTKELIDNKIAKLNLNTPLYDKLTINLNKN